jgi:Flp pilus assembly protein TadG
MRNQIRRMRRRRAGNSAVELALAFAVLGLLTMGIADFGRIYYTTIELSNAATAGAIYGAFTVSRSSDIDGMKTAALNEAADLTGVDVTTVPPLRYCQCPDKSTNDCSNINACGVGVKMRYYVKVTTKKTYKTMSKFPGMPNTIDITRQTVMRVQ